eukprot:1156752-Pelagomonas_calceolata.AAC.4
MLRPGVLTILDFNQERMALACMQLMRLSHSVSYTSPLCGTMPAAQSMMSHAHGEQEEETLSEVG